MNMKKLLLATGTLLMMQLSQAQSLTTPQPSPTQTIKQNFALSSIEINYSRPGIKGRKVFGDLVPYGKVWRTGANSATTLTFGDTVTIGGTKIKPGKYGLLSIPDKNSWTMIITKQLDVTSPAAYKADQDVVRVEVKPMKMSDAVETFTMQIANIKPNSCELHLMWENTAVALPISTDVESKVMADINQLMFKDNKPYFAAAAYYLENGKDLNQALAWFDKAIEQTPDAFWIHHQRANCLAKMGKKAEAKAAAQKSKDLAIAAKNDDYVRLNDKLMAELDK